MSRGTRIFLRLLFTWVVLAPIGVYFAFPLILGHIQQQARSENHTKCLKETEAYPQTFDRARPEIAGSYCDCVVQGIILTKDDLIAMVKKQPTDRLNKAVAKQVDQCNYTVEHPRAQDAQVIYIP